MVDLKAKDGVPCGKGWISKKKKCKDGKQMSQPRARLSFVDQMFPEMKRLRTIQAEKKRIESNRRESAVIVSNKTGDVLYRGREGSATSCDIENPDDITGNTLLHNHPTHVNNGKSNSFSLADLQIACNYQAAELLAVNERYEYKMRPPRGGWNESFFENKLKPSFDTHSKKVSKEYVKKVFSGEYKVDILGRIKNQDVDYYHDVWKQVAKDTGMVYTKKDARTGARRDAVPFQNNAKQPKEVEQLVGTILSRAYPVLIKRITVQPKNERLIQGLFLAADNKTYDYEIDLSNNNLSYSINSRYTPRSSFREDSAKDKPSCRTGIPCQGARGTGCISRQKKCTQKLNRIATPGERTRLASMAQESFSIEDQAAFKKQLDEMTIRELRILGKGAGISNYGNQTKETLVNTLTSLKAIESSPGDYRETGEDKMRRVLNRREKEFQNLSVIDPSKVAMTKEEMAKKRAEEAIVKRRIGAAKKAVSVLLPGSSKVIDGFSRAASTEDKIIAGTVAGILALQIYGARKREFEANYRKSIDEQAEMLYSNDDMVGGDKNPGKEVRELRHYYEGERLTPEQADAFVENFKDEKGKSLRTSKVDGATWKRMLEMAKTGGNKEDDIDWQTQAQQKKLVEEGNKAIAAADKNVLKKDLFVRRDEGLLKSSERFSTLLNNEKKELEDEIKRVQSLPEGQQTGLMKSTLKRPYDLVKGAREQAKASQEAEDRAVELGLREYEEAGATPGEIRKQEEILRFAHRSQVVSQDFGDAPKVTASLAELQKAQKYLEDTLIFQQASHETRLNNQVTLAKANAEIAREERDTAYDQWGYTKSSSPDDKAKLAAESSRLAKQEIDRRRDNPNIKQNPLFQDFGEVKEGKPSRYQAWVLANYRRSVEKNGIVEANRQARENSAKYSLSTFKKQLPVAIAVGSERGKAEEIASILKNDPDFKGFHIIPAENEYSKNASVDDSKESLTPYVGRLGKYIKKAVPANNRIPGLEPTSADNLDATRLAAKIVALQKYGVEPRIVAHGVGGTILQEALDIVASSKDNSALDSTRAVIFGSPNMYMTKRKRARGLVNSYYSPDDFIGRNFGGKQKEMLGGVSGSGYSDYLSSEKGKAKIKDLFK